MVARVRVVLGATLVVLLASALLLATEKPASAHYQQVFQGSDYAVVYADHFSGAVCDKEVDGHYVYAQWVAGASRFTATDGGDPGCDYKRWASDAASEFRVCESIAGRKDPCSDWART